MAKSDHLVVGAVWREVQPAPESPSGGWMVRVQAIGAEVTFQRTGRKSAEHPIEQRPVAEFVAQYNCVDCGQIHLHA